MTAFVAEQTVRDYLAINTDSTSRYNSATVLSNIRTASEFLERATGRYFANQTGVTLTFTTNGEPIVDLPGVRSVTSATLAGSALTANTTYWLLPDAQQSGVYTSIQLRGFTTRGPWWLSVPDWFDRNLDSPYNPANWGGGYGSLPNDLVIVADVGYLDGTLPEPLLMACKVLAAWYTKRPDAVLQGSTLTPEGNQIVLDDFPPEVAQFISDWRIGTHQAVSLG